MHCNSKYEIKIHQKRLISWQWNKNKWIIQRSQQLDHDHDEDDGGDDDDDDSSAALSLWMILPQTQTEKPIIVICTE